MSLGAPSSSLWGPSEKEGPIRSGLEELVLTEEWQGSQVGSPLSFPFASFLPNTDITRVHVCCCSAEFSIWTREAGAGGLSIAVEGPSKAEITFEDRKDGSCGVSYVVQEPGEFQAVLRADVTEYRRVGFCVFISQS